MNLKKIVVAVGSALSDRMFAHASRMGLILGALPLEIADKAAFEKLPKEQQGLYKEDAGKYRLEVDGLEDTSGLKTALEKERDARRKTEKEHKEFMKKYDGIDPENVKALMSHFESSEEAELLKQGGEGVKKIVEKRVSKAQEAHRKEIEQMQEEAAGAMEVASTFMDRVLEHQIMQAAIKANVIPEAMDDVVLRAKQMFNVDDDGNAVQFEDDGETVVFGKDGKTPYTVNEWIEGMQDKAPHWFMANNRGGGGTGNRGTNLAGKKTMKRAAFENLPQGDRHAFTKDGGVVVD